MRTTATVRTPGRRAHADDPLHRPVPGDPTAGAYKEWLHVNLADHATGTVGLVNASLHGDPSDPRSLVLGTAMLHDPVDGWAWSVEPEPPSRAGTGWASVSTPSVAVAAGLPGGHVAASVRSAGLVVDLAGEPVLAPFDVLDRLPFGSGWISWSVLPRLRLRGSARLHERAIELDGASGYHDRNWGRWRWGDDAGWEWGVFLAPEPAPVLVWSRATDHAHARGEPVVVLHDDRGRVRWTGEEVRVERSGRFGEPPLRVPGALAALHTGRSGPRLPGRVVLRLRGSAGRLDVELQVRGAAQLLAAEPTVRGTSHLHELVGPFLADGTVRGRPLALAGLAVVEHVD